MQEDRELASRCLRGEDGAWETLVRRYHRKVWNIAYHFVGRAEEADELAQEIFIHVFQVLRSFDPQGSLLSWLLRVARNYSIDHYRRRRRERALTSNEEVEQAAAGSPSNLPDPYAALERKDLAAWIRAALGRLPKELAQAVVLRDLQDMSYEEMSELLAVPLGTVKSRINRGRIELARLLARRKREWSAELERGTEP